MAESGQVPGLDGFLVSVPTCDVHAPDVPIAADCMVPDEENAKDKKGLKGKDKAIIDTSPEVQAQPGVFDRPRLLERQPTTIVVPSSKSPSPMKSLKNIGSGGSRLSLSPVKIDHEATKALQESITSLLGKRPTPEREDMAGGPADVPNARNGKRARPHRSKVS